MKYSLFTIGVGLFIAGGLALYLTSFDTVQSTVTQMFSSKSVIYSSENIADIEKGEDETQKTDTIDFTFYYDFECPYCSQFFTETFLPLQKKYAESFTFSLLPYALNPEGKGFEMSTWFVCLQKENITDEKIITTLSDNSELDSLGELFELSAEKTLKFTQCIDNEETSVLVKKIRDDAKKRGVRGTPTFFIGDEKFEKNQSLKKVELKIIEILGE